MRHVTRIATVALLIAIAASLALAGPLRRDGPSQNRKKIVNMMTEGRTLAIEAGKLRKEAIDGRVLDKSAPRDSDGKRTERWIELKQKERLSRFAQSKSKLAAAIGKAAEAEEFLKKHPNVALDDRPTAIREKWTDEYARTVVAEARFRMNEKIGKLSDWQRLAKQALKINKDCIEAQRLNEDLVALEKKMEEEAEAERKEAAEKRKADAQKRKDEAAAKKAEAEKDTEEDEDDGNEAKKDEKKGD